MEHCDYQDDDHEVFELTMKELDRFGYALCDIFARLLKLSEIGVRTVLTYVMAESLEAGNASVEALGSILPVSMDDSWTPDVAFFDLLRDKQTINAMLGEIAGKEVVDANIAETVKV